MAFTWSVKPNMEILLYGNILQIFLIIFLLPRTLIGKYLLCMVAYLPSYNQLIKLKEWIDFKRSLMMALYAIWCGVTPKRMKMVLRFRLEVLGIYSVEKFWPNSYILMGSNIYQEHINSVHRAINYYLKINYQQSGQHPITSTEWEI